MIPLSWFWLSLGYALVMAGFYFLSKKLLVQKDLDGPIFGGLVNLGVGLVALPVALASGWQFQLSLKNILLLAGSATAVTVGVSFFYTGVKNVDLSEMIILGSSNAVYLLFLGWLIFAEPLTLQKVLAAALVLIAVWLAAGLKQIHKFTKYEFYILLACLFYSLGISADKYLVGQASTPTYIALSFLTPGIFLTVLNIARRASIFGQLKVAVKGLALVCLVQAGAYGFLYSAYRTGEISRIETVIQSQVVFTALLGVVFLKERRNLGLKLLSVLVLVAGLFLLKI